ncbi:hypothetical protein V4V35_23585 [Bacillus infantis]|uniref:hypothetical protein n=1 Tax=Bacillus infantis TaxID=324767 RepID=UPI002FBD6111
MIFASKRIQTVGSIQEFCSGEPLIRKEIKKFNKAAASRGIKASLTFLGGTIAIGLTPAGATNYAYAQGPVEYVKGRAKEQIVEAFMPLVDMIQALSYPIALVMLTGGALMFMINQKDRGISLIQNASIGYILVQLMPIVMKLLVGIGTSVSAGVIFPIM